MLMLFFIKVIIKYGLLIKIDSEVKKIPFTQKNIPFMQNDLTINDIIFYSIKEKHKE